MDESDGKAYIAHLGVSREEFMAKRGERSELDEERDARRALEKEGEE